MVNPQIKKYKKYKEEIEDIENSIKNLELSLNNYYTHINRANVEKEELLKKKEIYAIEYDNFNIIKNTIKEIQSFVFNNNLLTNNFYFVKECVGENLCLVNYQLVNAENEFFTYKVIKIYDNLEITKTFFHFNLPIIIDKYLEFFINNELKINKPRIEEFFYRNYFIDELYQKKSSDFCYDFSKANSFFQKKKIIELMREIEENKNV